MSTISISNHGPLIVATDYWTSDLAREGRIFVSVKAGAIRILLPPAAYPMLIDMRLARQCVLSRGPWPAERRREAIEIMWDDGSDSPFALHLTPESFDLLPAEPEPGQEWICSVWTAKDGRPHKALDRKCHWRRVPELPWLQPFSRRVE